MAKIWLDIALFVEEILDFISKVEDTKPQQLTKRNVNTSAGWQVGGW